MIDTTHHRLIIADDHPLFRGALREAVVGSIAHVEIAEAGSFEDVAKLLDLDGNVDLVLLDLAMPGVRGFSGLFSHCRSFIHSTKFYINLHNLG